VLTAVILSAGESSRMGSPKALLPCRGKPFLEHLLGVLRQAMASQPSAEAGRGIGEIRVVLGAHTAEISDALRLPPSLVVVNPEWKQGQLSSIQAAISSVADDSSDGVMLFLVDHPLISADLVRKLAAEFYGSGRAIVVPTFRGKRGHPVIFARRLFRELLEAPAEQGARAVVWAHADKVLEVPTEEEGILLNLNDPETLRRALG
jgi:molybdenum cofactor cytidylyltransferase